MAPLAPLAPTPMILDVVTGCKEIPGPNSFPEPIQDNGKKFGTIGNYGHYISLFDAYIPAYKLYL